MKTPVKAVHLPSLPEIDEHDKIRIGQFNNSDYSVYEAAAPINLPLIAGE